MTRGIVALSLLMVLALSLGGCETSQSVTPVEQNRVAMAPWSDVVPPYRLNSGDKIRVSYQRTPELNEVVLVGPDGWIGLRAAGQVEAGGQTIANLEQSIAKAASHILNDPMVTVGLEEAGGAVVYVGGAVRNSGVYPLGRRVGTLEAIFRAGGFDPEARMTKVVLIRRGEADKPMLRTIDVRDFAGTATLEDDVPLVAGDIVFVPRERVAEVGRWVDMYINRLLPFSRSFSYVTQPSTTNGLF